MNCKMKIIAIIALVCILIIGVGSTVALLTSISRPVTNSFTVGEVKISLDESTGTLYKLTPGVRVTKDPKVTVKGGSEDCWLFVRLTKSSGFDDLVSMAVADGWTHLDGSDGIYFRSVAASDTDTVFHVLKDDSVTVKDSITKEAMATITDPTLTFRAYAIQSHGIDTAALAWTTLQSSIQE